MSTLEESRVEWFHVFNVPSDAKHRVILQRGFVLLRVTIFTLERFHGIRGILQCRLQTGFIFSLSLCPSVRPSRLNKRQYTFRIVKSISKTDSQSKFLEEKFFHGRNLGRILENTGVVVWIEGEGKSLEISSLWNYINLTREERISFGLEERPSRSPMKLLT